MTPIKPGLLYAYIEYAVSGDTSFSAAYFSGPFAKENALNVCRYAFEILLGWSPQDVRDGLSAQLLHELKLDPFVALLDMDPEILAIDHYIYLAHMMYPEEIKYSKRDLAVHVYDMVLSKKKPRFPKNYFDGFEGRLRARYCFAELVKRNCAGQFNSIQEGYAFFTSVKGIDMINKNALGFVLRSVFVSPVLFYHLSLPASDRDEFWFHYYNFLYLSRHHFGSKIKTALLTANHGKAYMSKIYLSRVLGFMPKKDVALCAKAARNEADFPPGFFIGEKQAEHLKEAILSMLSVKHKDDITCALDLYQILGRFDLTELTDCKYAEKIKQMFRDQADMAELVVPVYDRSAFGYHYAKFLCEARKRDSHLLGH